AQMEQEAKSAADSQPSADRPSSASTQPGAATSAGAKPVPPSVEPTPAPASVTLKPVLPPGVPEYFLPTTAPSPVYKPKILGAASIRYTDTKSKLDYVVEKVFCAELSEGAISLNWSDSREQRISVESLQTAAPADAKFSPLPSAASKATQ